MTKLSESQKNKIKNRVSRRRKARPFKAPTFPDMIVMEYGKAINREINKLDKLIKEILVPELPRITNTKNERLDITNDELKKLTGIALTSALVAKIKSKFYGEILDVDQEPSQRIFSRSIKKLVKPFIKRADKFQEAKFIAEFEKQTGTKPLEKQINVDVFLDEAFARNVNLIKTLPSKHLSDVVTLVDNAVQRGQLSGDVVKELTKIKAKTKDRSRLIARDQIAKLIGVTNEARQRKLGVSEYIWLTMQDSRVRSLSNSGGSSDHKRLEGTIQSWSRPPVTVFKGKRAGERHHPGEDINCRCIAQPVYDEITGIEHKDTIEARKRTA